MLTFVYHITCNKGVRILAPAELLHPPCPQFMSTLNSVLLSLPERLLECQTGFRKIWRIPKYYLYLLLHKYGSNFLETWILSLKLKPHFKSVWFRAPGLRPWCTLPWKKGSGSFSRTVTWHPAGCLPWRDSLRKSTQQRSAHMHTHTVHCCGIVLYVRQAFHWLLNYFLNCPLTPHISQPVNRCTKTSVCG